MKTVKTLKSGELVYFVGFIAVVCLVVAITIHQLNVKYPM